MDPVELPLGAFERFRTADPVEARERVQTLLSAHRLMPTGRVASLDVRYHAVDLADSAVICAQYGTAVRLDPGALEDFYLVGMPLAGASIVCCGGREIVTHPGLASVQSCTHPVVTQWREDCRKLSVKIGRRALERRLAALLGRPPSRPVVFDLALDLERGGGASWRRLVGFLLVELSPDSIYLASPAARHSLEDTLIATLLYAQSHNYSDALHAPAEPALPRHVRRVEEIVAADPSRPHALADLAAQVGVSVRSLQAGFRRHRDMSPVEFVRVQRLAQARAVLLDAAPGMRVTEVALEVGYAHLGRFARDYKARYGESPSQTLRRG